MYTTKLYRRSPIFVQNILVSVKGLLKQYIRDGASTKKLEEVLQKNEKSSSTLINYSSDKLFTVLQNATSNTAFYNKIDSHNFDKFPVIDKSIVKSCHSNFYNLSKTDITINGTTSGTSGSPLMIPQTKESIVTERAFANRQRAWAGFKKGDKRAWLRGDLVVPVEQSSGPFWRYSWFEDMIILSSFHMRKDVLGSYIEAMYHFGVDVIQAYPSSIVTLAKYLQQKGEYYPGKLKSILTSSENLTDADRAVVEKYFQCKVFDWYGQFERVAAIANCEHGRYHILTDYSHVEFEAAGDGKYEIIGTNYNNSYFPLIRYRTGDQVVLSDEKECPCGRIYPIVKEIVGREVQHVFNTKGEKVYALDQCVKGAKGIIGSQFIQKKLGEIIINVIADGAFDNDQQAMVVANVKARLGQEMLVNFEHVSELKKTNTGKAIQAICLIKGT